MNGIRETFVRAACRAGLPAGQTVSADWPASLRRVAAILGESVQLRMLVFGGAGHYVREGVEVVGLQASFRNTG